MKKHIIFTLCCISCIIVFAQAKLGFRGEDAATVGIYVKDLKTGKVIAQNDAQRGMIPASTMKAVTAASAISLLDPDFKFKTPVYLTGAASEGNPSEWIGNIVIESCGDPTIDSEEFSLRQTFDSEIINALKAKGIESIKGNIIIKETLKDAGCIPLWEIDDVPWAYGAGLYGFNFNDNYFSLCPATGMTKPEVPDLAITLIKQEGSVDLVRGIDSNELTVKGMKVYDEKWKVNASMPNPAKAFKATLILKMLENDMQYESQYDEYDNSELLITHYSPALTDILGQMMKKSHNLFAEAMLRTLAPNGDRDDALTKESNFLSTIVTAKSYNKICDGSGLARADRLQPIFLSNLLEAMASGPNAKKYISLFPKVGVEGTVKSLLSDTKLKGKLALKSGSMGGVQCFAGYKLDANGKPTHTVVVMVNSFYCPRKEVYNSIEKFLLNTFNF